MGASLIALAVVAILVLLAMVLIINFKQWKTSFFLIFIYVFTLAAVWRMELLSTLFLITGVFFLIASIIKEPNLHQKYITLVYSASILIFFLCIGISFFIYYGVPIIPDFLKEETKATRENLSQRGFYETLYGGLNTNSGSSRATTGLRTNDESLGGPVYQNNSFAFSVTSPEPHYWRVATRDLYIGTGWTSSGNKYDHVGSYFSYSQFKTATQTNNDSYPISYTFPKDSPIYTQGIPLATGNIEWNVPNVFDLGTSISFDSTNSQLFFSNRPDTTTFSFDFLQTNITVEELNASTETNSDADDYLLYTQLPTSLPSRVKSLAEEITKDKVTQYEKTVAIEAYLKQEGNFTYSLEEAPFLPEGQDYVDYFLFESKIGYCEQFSSAMVVMLRSIGIQSRWAKGFSTGSLSQANEDGTNTYTIRNRNAHAWPEVYFDDIGWVDFEPTPSFTMNDTDDDTTDESDLSSSSEESSSSGSAPSPSSNSISSSAITGTSSTEINKAQDSFIENFATFIRSIRFVLYGLLVFCIILGIIFRKDFFWMIFLLRIDTANSFKKSYVKLLKGLNFEMKRNPNETLQAYAEKIEWNSENEKKIFINLTEAYENIIYGNEKDPSPTTKQKQWFKRIARNQGLRKK